jgi:DNA-binding MarR family transcriptional regulator/GNAT superfamily N-acetyltransferase
MDRAAVAKVRRFNRVVTQRVGALDEHFLRRGRPLGAARLLWEIGDEGSDVRALRARLDLDSGYLSRLLRSLEAAGLVTVGPGERDRRVRTARLTRAGLRERAVLDRRGDDLAASFLEPLNGSQRERLVAAMGDVERMLTAAMVRIAPIDPAHPDAQSCLRAYYAELGRRFDGGYDLARTIPVTEAEARPPAGIFLVASLHTEPIGCGVLKLHDGQPSEIKRMWVAESARGLGVGRRLLVELENRALQSTSPIVRLETNKALTEAIAMYRSAGYTEVAPFNDEPYAHHWFEKRLRMTGAGSAPGWPRC